MADNAFFQNSLYVGNNFIWILYGVNLALYAQTMCIFTLRESPRQRSTRFFMFFSTIMLVLITIYVIMQSTLGEEMWIINAHYPGGSAAYFAANASDWRQTMNTTSSVILQLMSDGLLIYRCLIVWRDRRIIVLPCFLWLVTLVFCIFDLYISGSPNGNISAHFGVTCGVAISIGQNVLVTSLICGRILHHAHSTRKSFGSAVAETYFSTVAIIIESALPYTLSGVTLAISYGMNSEISILFISIYIMFTCLSPQMLIFRVASGRAWNSDTGMHTEATMRFERGATVGGLPTTDEGKVTWLKDEENEPNA